MSEDPSDPTEETPEKTLEDAIEELNFPDGRGILSDKDRLFLLRQHSELRDLPGDVKNKAQKRWRMREKISNAFYDFYLLDKFLPDEELDLILDDIYAEAVDPTDLSDAERQVLLRSGDQLGTWGAQYDHLVGAMSFLYRAAESDPILTFEHLIEQTVYRNIPLWVDDAPFGEGRYASSVDIEVDINLDIEWSETYDLDAIEDRLDRGEALTREEIGELFLQGRLEPGDVNAEDITSMPRNAAVSGPRPGISLDSLPEEGWKEVLQKRLPDEMVAAVDWDDVESPIAVWGQLEAYHDGGFLPN